jgi:hypothetical protein
VGLKTTPNQQHGISQWAYIFYFTMKAEDLFDATEQLPAKKAIVKIIDLKIDNDMREAITKMEALFAATNARVDAIEKHVGGRKAHG